jgi:predicted nucleic acid-binding protein
LDFFTDLGQRVERRWAAHEFDETVLAAIAAEELDRRPAHLELGPDDIYAEITRPDLGLELQSDIEATFGQPPITLYVGRGLYIDANVWVDATTSIHQHAFDGAFQVLAGSSVHSTYRFHERQRVTSHLKLGKLEFANVELLTPGQTREIHAGPALIHALFHLEEPSLTLVVRAYEDTSHGRQYTYLPPGLAIDPFYRPESLVRRLQLLRMLRLTNHERYREWLRRLVLGADAYSAFRVMSQASEIAEDERELDELVAPLALELAAQRVWGIAVEQALRQSFSSRALLKARASVKDPERRWFLALLLNVPHAGALYALIHERHPDQDPVEQAHVWTTALAAEPDAAGLGLEFGEGSLSVLRGLMKKKPYDRIAAELAEVYGQTPEVAEIHALDQDFRASCLRPLLESA